MPHPTVDAESGDGRGEETPPAPGLRHAQQFENLFARLAQLRISHAGHAQEVGELCGFPHSDRGEGEVLEHHLRGHARSSPHVRAPPPAPPHRLTSPPPSTPPPLSP